MASQVPSGTPATNSYQIRQPMPPRFPQNTPTVVPFQQELQSGQSSLPTAPATTFPAESQSLTIPITAAPTSTDPGCSPLQRLQNFTSMNGAPQPGRSAARVSSSDVEISRAPATQPLPQTTRAPAAAAASTAQQRDVSSGQSSVSSTSTSEMVVEALSASTSANAAPPNINMARLSQPQPISSEASSAAHQLSRLRDSSSPRDVPSTSEPSSAFRTCRGVLSIVDVVKQDMDAKTCDYIMRNADGNLYCSRSECADIRFETHSAARVHNLRHNSQNIFFCLECGSAFPFENLIVKHMIERHNQKQVPTLSLQCPFCPSSPIFTEVAAFRVHMASDRPSHAGAIYKSRSRCKLTFHTMEARLLHEKEHRSAPDLQCCYICGTTRWWFQAPAEDLPYIDHSYIHAFQLFALCRECGLCVPDRIKVTHCAQFLTFLHESKIRSSDT
ncbi:unnamed protein product [Gongylonema pulchrum]|uniref:C2H2-type domain-containing protein n=1 Tax=Gongylonema pulchrum TaxID=637853 RepID=A0A183DZL4_9BILA|nr:unnamed protein product [Gongylonema pulchrum]